MFGVEPLGEEPSVAMVQQRSEPTLRAGGDRQRLIEAVSLAVGDGIERSQEEGIVFALLAAVREQKPFGRQAGRTDRGVSFQ